MGKLFLLSIVVIAVILGAVAFLTHKSAPSSNPAIPLQGIAPTANPSASSGQASQISPTPATPSITIPPQSQWVTNATSAAIVTNKGEIDIELYPQDAPKTVTNFATLASIGYYNNLTFHRVVPGFVIQGGDPNGNGTGGYSIYGKTFDDELNPNTPSYKAGYLEGVVAMANAGPNTNGSQFFIMLADNLDLPKAYTIFGKVTSGMDVVQKIAVGDKMLSVTVK